MSSGPRKSSHFSVDLEIYTTDDDLLRSVKLSFSTGRGNTKAYLASFAFYLPSFIIFFFMYIFFFIWGFLSCALFCSGLFLASCFEGFLQSNYHSRSTSGFVLLGSVGCCSAGVHGVYLTVLYPLITFISLQLSLND